MSSRLNPPRNQASNPPPMNPRPAGGSHRPCSHHQNAYGHGNHTYGLAGAHPNESPYCPSIANFPRYLPQKHPATYMPARPLTTIPEEYNHLDHHVRRRQRPGTSPASRPPRENNRIPRYQGYHLNENSPPIPPASYPSSRRQFPYDKLRSSMASTKVNSLTPPIFSTAPLPTHIAPTIPPVFHTDSTIRRSYRHEAYLRSLQRGPPVFYNPHDPPHAQNASTFRQTDLNANVTQLEKHIKELEHAYMLDMKGKEWELKKKDEEIRRLKMEMKKNADELGEKERESTAWEVLAGAIAKEAGSWGLHEENKFEAEMEARFGFVFKSLEQDYEGSEVDVAREKGMGGV